MERIEELESYAKVHDIPIMQLEGMECMLELIEKYHVKRVLEIGSAIGYSALMMSKNAHVFVETIERDKHRYELAVKNIEKYKPNTIIIHYEDALELDENKLQKHYDMIFIDAAKAQYQRFFEKYIPYLNEGGIVLVDNLDFHGMIFDIEHIKNRNTRALVRKIKRFKDWIFNHEEYEASYIHKGDGLCLIQRKGHS